MHKNIRFGMLSFDVKDDVHKFRTRSSPKVLKHISVNYDYLSVRQVRISDFPYVSCRADRHRDGQPT